MHILRDCTLQYVRFITINTCYKKNIQCDTSRRYYTSKHRCVYVRYLTHVVRTNDVREENDGWPHNCGIYISCRFFLSPASSGSSLRSSSRLVITVVVIGPETAVALVQLRSPAIFRPVPLKPGGFPAAHKALTAPRLLRKKGDRPRNLPGGRSARRTR